MHETMKSARLLSKPHVQEDGTEMKAFLFLQFFRTGYYDANISDLLESE